MTRREIQERMSTCGAHIRDPKRIQKTVDEAWDLYSRLKNDMKIPSIKDLPAAFKIIDLCLTHALYLEAIKEYMEKGGQSRGSYLIMDPEGEIPCKELGDEWKFHLNEEDSFVNTKILEIYLDKNTNVKKQWIDIRPIPLEDVWFENIWNEYMKDNIIK